MLYRPIFVASVGTISSYHRISFGSFKYIQFVLVNFLNNDLCGYFTIEYNVNMIILLIWFMIISLIIQQSCTIDLKELNQARCSSFFGESDNELKVIPIELNRVDFYYFKILNWTEPNLSYMQLCGELNSAISCSTAGESRT